MVLSSVIFAVESSGLQSKFPLNCKEVADIIIGKQQIHIKIRFPERTKVTVIFSVILILIGIDELGVHIYLQSNPVERIRLDKVILIKQRDIVSPCFTESSIGIFRYAASGAEEQLEILIGLSLNGAEHLPEILILRPVGRHKYRYQRFIGQAVTGLPRKGCIIYRADVMQGFKLPVVFPVDLSVTQMLPHSIISTPYPVSSEIIRYSFYIHQNTPPNKEIRLSERSSILPHTHILSAECHGTHREAW